MLNLYKRFYVATQLLYTTSHLCFMYDLVIFLILNDQHIAITKPTPQAKCVLTTYSSILRVNFHHTCSSRAPLVDLPSSFSQTQLNCHDFFCRGCVVKLEQSSVIILYKNVKCRNKEMNKMEIKKGKPPHLQVETRNSIELYGARQE